MDKLKRWVKYAIIFICIGSGIFILGYMVRGWSGQTTVTVGGGEIVERTNIIYTPVTYNGGDACAGISSKYNSLLADYKLFLGAVPDAYSVTDDKIYFKIHTQKYSLAYKVHEKSHITITPTAYARLAFAPALGVYYGGGCFGAWNGITVGVLADNQPALTVSLGYAIIIP